LKSTPAVALETWVAEHHGVSFFPGPARSAPHHRRGNTALKDPLPMRDIAVRADWITFVSKNNRIDDGRAGLFASPASRQGWQRTYG
jgi:hypothetical protein